MPHLPHVMDMYQADRQGRERSALVNSALQAAYFIVGVRSAGPAAGPMSGFDSAGVQKEFLDDDHTPIMVVTLGKPGANAWYPRSPRLDFDEVATVV